MPTTPTILLKLGRYPARYCYFCDLTAPLTHKVGIWRGKSLIDSMTDQDQDDHQAFDATIVDSQPASTSSTWDHSHSRTSKVECATAQQRAIELELRASHIAPEMFARSMSLMLGQTFHMQQGTAKLLDADDARSQCLPLRRSNTILETVSQAPTLTSDCSYVCD